MRLGARRAVPVAVLLVLVSLTGCLGGEDVERSEQAPAVRSGQATGHVLVGAHEPAGFQAPGFEVLGTVAEVGYGIAGGEPGTWAAPDGTLYVTFPGCDTSPLAATPVFRAAGQPHCAHGLVFRTDAPGGTWERLNDETTGELAPGAPVANGDADLAVDAAGTVYASDLGSGRVQVFASTDRGDRWTHLGDVVPEEDTADRQWMAAGADGHLVMAWMTTGGGCERCVTARTTFDGGQTWTDPIYVGQGIGWLGPIQLDPEGERAYVPYTRQVEEGTFGLHIARSDDGGISWTGIDTGLQTTTYGQLATEQWSGVHMAPVMDITGDGTLVYAWSEQVPGPTDQAPGGTVVRLSASLDRGATWGPVVDITQRPNAIMPWISGGGGDRVAITYYASDIEGPPDRVGLWDVEAAWIDGVATSKPRIERAIVEADVHQGGICSRGGNCALSGADRSLLDFFENEVLPDGRLFIAYAVDPADEGRVIQIRAAVQDAGSPLFTRLDPAAGGPSGSSQATRPS